MRHVHLLAALAAAVLVAAASPVFAAVDPALMRADASLGTFDDLLGTAGIVAADIMGDGTPEVVVGHSRHWYVLRHEPESARYVQVVHVDPGFAGFSQSYVDLDVGDVDGDGDLEVVVLTSNAERRVHDALTGALVDTQPTPGVTVNAVVVADVDPAAGEEIVVLARDDVRVFGAGISAALWTVPATGGQDIAVGQVDGDAALEIVVGRGSADGLVIDAGLRALEWAHPGGFGGLVDVGDVDGDGMDEIVGVGATLLCIDGDTQQPKWSVPRSGTSALRVADTDQDGFAEVILGDSQWGDVHGHDGFNGSLVWSIPNPEHSVSAIDVADVDSDCQAEVLWGAGYSSSGEDHLYVGDPVLQSREWENTEDDGPITVLAVGDLDGDGRTEVLHGTPWSNSGYGDGMVHVSDLHHRRGEIVATAPFGNGDGQRGVAMAQLDGDAALEVVMQDNTIVDGRITVFDGATLARQWQGASYRSQEPQAFAAGDVDDDGDVDVVVGWFGTGATADVVRVHQASDLTLAWESPALTGVGSFPDVRVADLDADGRAEIVAGIAGLGLRAWDGITRLEEWNGPLASLLSLDVADLEGDGDQDVVLGTNAGGLSAYDGPTQALLWSTNVGGLIYAIRAFDVDGDGVPEIVLTRVSGGTGHVEVRSSVDRSLIWRGPTVTGSPGNGSALFVGDADDDGKVEIVVGAGLGVHVWEYDADAPDVTPPDFGLGSLSLDAEPIPSSSCCPTVQVSWGAAHDDASPPVSFAIHRATASGFTPDATNLVGLTDRFAWRDVDVAPDTVYHYRVRALDAAGNEDANAAEVMIRTVDAVPPEAPVILDVRDVDPCSRTGVELTFAHPGLPMGVTFDVLVDGVSTLRDVASPVTVALPDSAPHLLRVQANHPACPLAAVSGAISAVDVGTGLPPPVIVRVDDADGCLRTGVTVEFTHAGFGGAGHHALLVDGVVVAEPVVSPVGYQPGDSLAHDYVVRAVDEDCPQQADSSPVSATDVDRTPELPTFRLEDATPCATGPLELRLFHPGFPGAGHFELWRDGSLFLSPVLDGTIFSAGDSVVHSWVVRAMDEDCALATDSGAVEQADVASCVGPTLMVAKEGVETALSWTAVPGAEAYNAYVGTVDSLLLDRAYDHLKLRPGMTFPDSPTPTTGCNVSGGPSLRGRVAGLRNADFYFVVVAWTAAHGEGPYGPRSDGVDRHDVSVDPRSPGVFCP